MTRVHKIPRQYNYRGRVITSYVMYEDDNGKRSRVYSILEQGRVIKHAFEEPLLFTVEHAKSWCDCDIDRPF